MNPQEAILITDRIRLELINTGVFRAMERGVCGIRVAASSRRTAQSPSRGVVDVGDEHVEHRGTKDPGVRDLKDMQETFAQVPALSRTSKPNVFFGGNNKMVAETPAELIKQTAHDHYLSCWSFIGEPQ